MPTPTVRKQEQESRRRLRRVPVLRMGTIVFGRADSRLECVVLDITDNGAKIRSPKSRERQDLKNRLIDGLRKAGLPA